MNVHFKEALATLSRGFTLIIFRSGLLVAGGFAVILYFGALLFVLRLAGGASRPATIVITLLAVLALWVLVRILRRLVFFRYRAGMLLLFSGWKSPLPGLAAVRCETGRYFNSYSQWQALNRLLRRALLSFYCSSGQVLEILSSPHPGGLGRFADVLAAGPISQAVLALAFSRGGMNIQQSAHEGLALYFRHGNESRRLARQWLYFSAVWLAFLFLCLVLPNWFFFKSAGAPVEIGIVLAAGIAWLLHQAFVQPFVLAGVTGALLAETSGKTPDPGLCEKLGSLVPDTALPGKRAD